MSETADSFSTESGQVLGLVLNLLEAIANRVGLDIHFEQLDHH
jgi:hypothetical protein